MEALVSDPIRLIFLVIILQVVGVIISASIAYNVGLERGFARFKKQLLEQMQKLKTADKYELQEFRALDLKTPPSTSASADSLLTKAQPAIKTVTDLIEKITLD